MWNRGSMLMPCVVTYVVPPPSPEGQKSQTAASTSAARALVLAALGAAVMVSTPARAGRGGRSAAPPGSEASGYSATVRPTASKLSMRGVR